MTITQTVEIPASRRIFLDLPIDVPVGKAKITVTPQTEKSTENIYETATSLRGLAKKWVLPLLLSGFMKCSRKICVLKKKNTIGFFRKKGN